MCKMWTSGFVSFMLYLLPGIASWCFLWPYNVFVTNGTSGQWMTTDLLCLWAPSGTSIRNILGKYQPCWITLADHHWPHQNEETPELSGGSNPLMSDWYITSMSIATLQRLSIGLHYDVKRVLLYYLFDTVANVNQRLLLVCVVIRHAPCLIPYASMDIPSGDIP